MEFTDEYQTRTIVYTASLGFCVLLIVLQAWNLLSHYYPKKSSKSNSCRTTISPFQLMFPLLASNGAFCLALIFYIISHLQLFSVNCSFCSFTIPSGGILYVVGKCCLYLFFGVRASVSQGIIQNFPQWLTKLFIPAMIGAIFLIYTVCFPVFFKGDCSSDNETRINSHC